MKWSRDWLLVDAKKTPRGGAFSAAFQEFETPFLMVEAAGQFIHIFRHGLDYSFICLSLEEIDSGGRIVESDSTLVLLEV